MKIVALYDIQASGRRIAAAFERVRRSLEPELEVAVSLWRCDLLDDPGIFKLALADGRSSEVLAVVFDRFESLSEATMRFVARWCTDQAFGDAALLVAPAHPSQLNSDREASTWAEFRQITRLNGLDLIVPGWDPVPEAVDQPVQTVQTPPRQNAKLAGSTSPG